MRQPAYYAFEIFYKITPVATKNVNKLYESTKMIDEN